MAESAVSFLLDQLSALLQEKRQLLGGLEREVESIRIELGQMRGFLRDADAKEETDSNLKEWITQLREISFDVEDVLDKYMLRFGPHARRGTTGLRGCMKRLYVSIKDLKARDQIAYEIQAIKYRLENVTKSHQKYRDMYGVLDQGSSSAISRNEWYDGRGEALFLDDDEVVGIEQPKEQLLKWIKSMDNGLDVIAVVGMGGLGKTTLVKRVYDDESVKKHFSKHAWVVVSDYKNVKHLLESLIKKLFLETKELPPQGLEDMDVDEMRISIFEFLKDKNYIVVLDDIWDVSRWEAIRFAFPKRGCHGCIIMTTRYSSIAEAACSQTNHVYNLKPLSPEKSEALLYKKAFPRNPCPPYLREFTENILQKCEGLPLAIVVIGGVLATKNNRADEWERFSRSLLIHESDSEGGSLKRLRKLLSLSYNDLPYYLKYCFLYLSIYPEGGLLDKEEIIRLWIAEGFVESKQHRIVEEVAEDYLNQLFSRSLIQVVQKDSDGTVMMFRIHDLLREYITVKSREHNMITICDERETQTQWPNKIRRLAVLKSINFSPVPDMKNKLKYLRSLLLLYNDGNIELELIKELLNKCRLLKVLDLAAAASLETIPDEVFKLYHLKYLCLSGTEVKLIPKEIQYLENLETLDLEWCYVTELPDEILKLNKLRHLLVHNIRNAYDVMFDHTLSVKAPRGIGSSLPSLQSLCCVDADEVGGVKMVREIGKLTQLRRLDIAKLRSEDGKELCSSIAKLTHLHSLKIISVQEGEKMELDYFLSSTGLPFLSTLELCGCIEKVPQWIPSLHGLTTLYLVWSRLREDPLNSLQHLPNLAHMWIHDAYVEELCFKAEGFQKLKKLSLTEFKCLKWVIVEEGSMSMLQDWAIWDCKLLTDLPKGIQHLTKLQDVKFGNMPSEFVDRFVEDKKNEGDNWRLAHVPYVHIGTVGNGFWTFNLHFHK
ncbi:hypothetical protein C2S52_013439 [Perilla frutescens var. hirtella]|nr:hypothetical protein C2S52_013439 [Perilla frutescens var. hirtella]